MVKIVEITEQCSKDFGETREEQEVELGSAVLSFDCAICLNHVSSSKRFKNEDRCVTHSYCVECIEMHIKAKLEDYNLAEIKCPALDCNEVLDALACRSILTPSVFERWCDVLCESTLMQCQRVYCPFQNCSALILNECDTSVTRSDCPICKKLFCFSCERPWHAGYSCDEAMGMTDQNDILFGYMMETKKWKRCPSCKHCVELESGCNIIKCRCGKAFCYLCGKKVDNDTHSCPGNTTLHIELGPIASSLVIFSLMALLIVVSFRLCTSTIKVVKKVVSLFCWLKRKVKP